MPRPFVSVIGCIPPDVLPDLAPDKGKEDGFLHRVLFPWPEPLSGRWNDAVIPEATQRAYHDLVATLYRLKMGPLYLALTDEALERWVTWHNGHLAESEDPLLSPYLQGAYAKLKGYGARLALIHALCCDPQAEVIQAESITAGVAIADYFKGQAAKVDEPLCRYVGNTNGVIERCKQAILRNLMAKGDLTGRDMQRNMKYNGDIFNSVWDFLTRPTLVSEDGIHWNLYSTTDLPTRTS